MGTAKTSRWYTRKAFTPSPTSSSTSSLFGSSSIPVPSERRPEAATPVAASDEGAPKKAPQSAIDARHLFIPSRIPSRKTSESPHDTGSYWSSPHYTLYNGRSDLETDDFVDAREASLHRPLRPREENTRALHIVAWTEQSGALPHASSPPPSPWTIRFIAEVVTLFSVLPYLLWTVIHQGPAFLAQHVLQCDATPCKPTHPRPIGNNHYAFGGYAHQAMPLFTHGHSDIRVFDWIGLHGVPKVPIHNTLCPRLQTLAQPHVYTDLAAICLIAFLWTSVLWPAKWKAVPWRVTKTIANALWQTTWCLALAVGMAIDLAFTSLAAYYAWQGLHYLFVVEVQSVMPAATPFFTDAWAQYLALSSAVLVASTFLYDARRHGKMQTSRAVCAALVRMHALLLGGLVAGQHVQQPWWPFFLSFTVGQWSPLMQRLVALTSQVVVQSVWYTKGASAWVLRLRRRRGYATMYTLRQRLLQPVVPEICTHLIEGSPKEALQDLLPGDATRQHWHDVLMKTPEHLGFYSFSPASSSRDVPLAASAEASPTVSTKASSSSPADMLASDSFESTVATHASEEQPKTTPYVLKRRSSVSSTTSSVSSTISSPRLLLKVKSSASLTTSDAFRDVGRQSVPTSPSSKSILEPFSSPRSEVDTSSPAYYRSSAAVPLSMPSSPSTTFENERTKDVRGLLMPSSRLPTMTDAKQFPPPPRPTGLPRPSPPDRRGHRHRSETEDDESTESIWKSLVRSH